MAPAFSTAPVLEFYDSDRMLLSFAVEYPEKTYRAGRDATNDWVIDHPQVSRHHFNITRDLYDAVTIEDTGSTNGISVNGIRITSPVELFPTDDIRLGDLKLIFRFPVTDTPDGSKAPPQPQPPAPPAPPAPDHKQASSNPDTPSAEPACRSSFPLLIAGIVLVAASICSLIVYLFLSH